MRQIALALPRRPRSSPGAPTSTSGVRKKIFAFPGDGRRSDLQGRPGGARGAARRRPVHAGALPRPRRLAHDGPDVGHHRLAGDRRADHDLLLPASPPRPSPARCSESRVAGRHRWCRSRPIATERGADGRRSPPSATRRRGPQGRRGAAPGRLVLERPHRVGRSPASAAACSHAIAVWRSSSRAAERATRMAIAGSRSCANRLAPISPACCSSSARSSSRIAAAADTGAAAAWSTRRVRRRAGARAARPAAEQERGRTGRAGGSRSAKSTTVTAPVITRLIHEEVCAAPRQHRVDPGRHHHAAVEREQRDQVEQAEHRAGPPDRPAWRRSRRRWSYDERVGAEQQQGDARRPRSRPSGPAPAIDARSPRCQRRRRVVRRVAGEHVERDLGVGSGRASGDRVPELVHEREHGDRPGQPPPERLRVEHDGEQRGRRGTRLGS